LAHIYVNVWLKSEILDPQGKAVAQALHRQGLSNVSQVRQGKRFRIDFEGEISQADLDRVSKEVLSNPVIEDFEIEFQK
jgi:phosphoribosylformylglycinamidine synthase subunit PurS